MRRVITTIGVLCALTVAGVAQQPSPLPAFEIASVKPNETIRVLASTLQLALGDEIIDRTGLSGSFDFYVTLPRPGQAAADAGEPSFFTAIQEQLGMKLQREEIIRDAFVVVRVSQPTPN